MKIHMTRIAMIAFFSGALAVLGASCGVEKSELEMETAASPFQITLSIPYDKQYNVALSSGVVIHFSEEVDPDSVEERIRIKDLAGGFTAFTTDVQRASIVLYPETSWRPRTEYSLTVLPGIRSISGRTCAKDLAITFQTGVHRPCAAEPLTAIRTMPGPQEPCWDFHTLRVFFNEPINRRTLEYGTAVRFTDLSTGELLPGNLFGRGNQIVFDPDEDMVPGRKYELTVTTMLKDHNGQGVTEDYKTVFEPISSGKRVNLAMDKCPTVMEGVGFCDPTPADQMPQSKFLDREVNSMFADFILIGPTNMQVGSRLWNEFGESGLWPDVTPFVIRKGQKLFGPGIASMAGGVIPSGIESGRLEITVLTDAVGELVGSELVLGVPGLPPAVRFTMDASIAMEDGASVANIGQPILGTTLVGQASVDHIDQIPDYDTLILEVVGFSEIEMLNEYVPVTLTLQMVPPPTTPEREYDTTPPKVVSVSPIPDSTDRMLGDEIIVAFSEPIDPDTFKDNIHLWSAEGRVSGTFDLYNPKVAFRPDEPLYPLTQYIIVVSSGITDISGNKMGEEKQYSFKTMAYQSSPTQPPMLSAPVPGIYAGSTLPRNFYPELYFSQIIDEDSLVYGETFGLYDDTDDGKLVSGTWFYRSIFMRFVPDEELSPGHHYRWVITQDVLNLDGLQLDTDMDRVPGGPNIEVPFTPAPYSQATQSLFVSYPYADADNSGLIDGDESPVDSNYMEMDFPLVQERTYMMGYFPITVYRITTTPEGKPRLPIDIEPSSLQFATSAPMSLGGNKAEPGLLEMGRVTIEILEGSSTDLFLAPDGLVGVDCNTTMTFDLENPLVNTLIDHDTSFKIPGALRFSSDGRMVVLVRGMSKVWMNIPLFGPMEIPLEVNINTATPPSRRGF